ncbi:MAG: polyprenyl synthetase family protein [Candidatus Thorarchaeota archaeon]
MRSFAPVVKGLRHLSEYEQIMTTELQRVSAALSEHFASILVGSEKMGPLFHQFYTNIRDYMMRGGKRLRPLLTVIGYKAISDQPAPANLYRVSCAVEFLHNGSLLHDDLIDRDETRRGGPTVHALYRDWAAKTRGAAPDRAAEFGAAMAILSGDSVLNMGAELIASSGLDPTTCVECMRHYQAAYHELVDGVLLEMVMVHDTETSTASYLDMIRMKTAALIEKSLLMGATIAGASESQKSSLSVYATRVGQAFQIQDDILGSFGDEKVTGKSADGDIREGKKTILVVKTNEMGSSEHRRILRELLGKRDMTPEEVDQVRKVFVDSGALEASRRLMLELLNEGQRSLGKALPPLVEKYSKFLLDFSEFLVKRDY